MPGVEGTERLARFKDFELDVRAAELHLHDGKTVRLPEQPFRILIILLERPGELVLREEIRKKLWPNDTIVEFEHSINAAINRLRQALGDSAENPSYIETLARRGYRWIVPVEWLGTRPATGEAVSATPTRPPTAEGLIGKKVSHYRVLEVLGGGGMGVVYKAEDLRLGRMVAIKFLGEEFTGDHRALERFEREARAISALDHPNICTIYEVEEHEAQPFLVMQLLQGQTLRQRIESVRPEQRAFSARELLDIALAIATGLEAAHKKGIIHRDVKPANIFITVRREVKLLDFGLAKLVAPEGVRSESLTPQEREPETRRSISPQAADASTSKVTLTGATMGTASYMSPEQVRRQPVDTRTDLFSFGAVLYEMATGHQLFRGHSTDVIHEAILNYTPPSPLLRNPDLPTELESIIVRTLEKDREKRYQSASEIISDLERVRLGESMPVPTAETGSAQVVQRAWVRIAVISVVVLLVTAGYVFRRWTPRHSGLHVENMEIARLTDSGDAAYAAISSDGRYVVYALRNSQKLSLRVRQVATPSDIELLRPDTVDFQGLSFSPDNNYVYFVRSDPNLPIYKSLYRMPVLGGPPRLLVKDVDCAASFSPDGRQFVFTRGTPSRNVTEVLIANADGTGEQVLAAIPDGDPSYNPGATWSPDGQTIAVPVYVIDHKMRFILYLISVKDGAIRELYSSAFPIGRAVWLPEGDNLVTTLWNPSALRGQLWTISYPRGELRRLTNDLTNYDLRTSLTRDGRILSAIQTDRVSNIWVAPATDLFHARQITFSDVPFYQVFESANGKLLAQTMDGKLWFMNPDGSQRTPFVEARAVDLFTTCGYGVVFLSNETGANVLTRVDADGSNATRLLNGDISDVTCSPEGKFVFYTNFAHPQKIWRIPVEGGHAVEIAGIRGESVVGGMSISPDGKSISYIYALTQPLSLKLAIVSLDRNLTNDLSTVPGDAWGVRWSPDGRGLQFELTRDGSSNLWEQPLAGGKPRQVTKFASGKIFDYHWSPDYRRLILTRGRANSDVVLLSNLH